MSNTVIAYGGGERSLHWTARVNSAAIRGGGAHPDPNDEVNSSVSRWLLRVTQLQFECSISTHWISSEVIIWSDSQRYLGGGSEELLFVPCSETSDKLPKVDHSLLADHWTISPLSGPFEWHERLADQFRVHLFPLKVALLWVHLKCCFALYPLCRAT